MLRAWLARAALLVTLCVLVLGCSWNGKGDEEGNVASRALALDGGPDAAPDAASGGSDGGVGTGDAGAAGGPACVTDADCGNGCGVCSAGSCAPAASTVVCRAAANLCDSEEKCNGTSTDCPSVDAKQPASHVCRPASGVCDADDKCDGTNDACPTADAKQPTSVVCRPANGVCDADDKCDGINDACPSADVKQPNTVVCRPANGVCDADDKCDGTNDACPATDGKQPNTVVCRPPAGACDAAETCDGTTNACPVADLKLPATVVCRVAAGVCDVAETCTGTSDACPALDVKQPSTLVCHPSLGDCDPAETCNGGNACPADLKQPSTFVCRASKGDCDAPETCNGGNTCPAVDAKFNTSHVCRAAVDPTCDVEEKCDGASDACGQDVKKAVGTQCRAQNGVCDVPESCDGSNRCPTDVFAGTNVNCGPVKGPCDEPEFCSGAAAACPSDKFSPSTKLCQDIIQPKCDVPEYCTGSGVACPANSWAAKGTACSDDFTCTEGDNCDGNGQCKGTATTDPAKLNQYCQASDHTCASTSCDPVAGEPSTGCKYTLVDKTFRCRPAAGVCDEAEFCPGNTGSTTDKDCPADAKKATTTQCRAVSCAAGTIKPAIACDGAANACPTVVDESCGNYACGDTDPVCRTTCTTSDHCGAAFYCTNNKCVPRAGAGQTCKTNAECSASNPNCVDGVCCDAPCKGQCEACNVQGSAGTCVGVTGKPVNERPACVGDGTKCDGFCDPGNRTACQFPTTAISCRDAACDTVTNAAVVESFCTGKGTCALSKPVECVPYACAGSACGGDCNTDAQCAKNAYCQAGKCTPKADLAGTCTTDKQCGSGHCADGVCCDSACTGQCEACNKVSGAKAGVCSAVTGAPLGDKQACAAGDPACGGACDGKTRLSCIYPGQGKLCREGTCSDKQASSSSYCDGHGACPSALTVACAEGCEGKICAGDECVSDGDCKESGKFCAAGVCTSKGAPGSTCSSAAQCATGFCTDGVCCDSACLGQCEACDASGSVGVCSAVPKGDSPHGGRTACAGDGSVCGGTCDGAARDTCKYPFDVVCRAGKCEPGATADAAGSAVLEATCLGNGACPAEQQQLCGVNGCEAKGQLCAGACASNVTKCQNDEYCSAGECVPKLPAATACANDAQCDSKFCVDGVCCDTRCGEQCAACDVPGKVGTCSAVLGGSHGGRAACAGVGSCGALCDGEATASCSFAGDTVSCGEAFCSVGVKGAAPLCDGQGVCAPAETTECASFSCEGTECSSRCTQDSECTKQRVCDQGKCVAPTLINAVDKGSCGCSVPGSRPRAPAGLVLLLTFGALATFRRRRAA